VQQPTLVLDVGPVAHGGVCVARTDGRVVFVRDALPGERVRAVVTEQPEHGRFWRARVLEVLEPAPGRVEPRCPVAGRCGGCDWQHADLATQRELKASVVAEQLRRLAGLDVPVVVEAVPGDEDGLAWRTRVRLAVDGSGRAGFRRARGHGVVPIDDCPLAHPALQLPSALERRWPAGAELEITAAPASTTPSVTLVPATGAARRVSGPARQVMAAAGRTWRVSGAGFWQVHPGAADTLVAAVRDALVPRPGERVLDCYSGVGLFAAALAQDVGEQGRVWAVEADAGAIKDARRALHDLPGVELVEGTVAAALSDGRVPAAADLVVLDPPRRGAGAAVCRALAARAPRAIAYVACDPASLARDVATFAGLGYELAALRAFDCFPMTHHVECVAHLTPR
jgi:tRNA/tmRNA/rRNA uracil-C5-methylase (TrmA/RlmC/RlmD family)